MSDTIIDMPKVCQMLDNGWQIVLFKNPIGSYTAKGRHQNKQLWHELKATCLQGMINAGWERPSAVDLNNIDFDREGVVDTDDFTPEQALTRLAYKVHGEII